VDQANRLEFALVQQMRQRGLARAPGPLAFVHRGVSVRASINESVYRGHYVTVHDTPFRGRQFRAHGGQFDWDAIAAHIVDLVERSHAGPRDARPASPAPFSIRPSAASPGRVRVSVPEMELDPASAMQLYALLQQARQVA
jgi:hypothetical protein